MLLCNKIIFAVLVYNNIMFIVLLHNKRDSGD